MTLRGISRELLRHGIAHGDIQPTNVIVQSTTDVRLIDYDGLFVPQLAGLQSTELGQRNSQHSGRRGRHFDASLDSFASSSLLDLTRHALCRRLESGNNATAMQTRSSCGPRTLLIPPVRLLEPAGSVPEIEKRVRHLAAICAVPFEQVATLEDFLRAATSRPGGSCLPATVLPLHRDYVAACDVVDATNFAQCCSHVGDRVEMIGKIVRVALDSSAQADTPCLRVESPINRTTWPA